MSAARVVSLDRLLGGAEFFGVLVSLVVLARACQRPSRRRSRLAVAFALVIALTVAQPLEVIARRVSPARAAGSTEDTGGVHTIRLAGVVPFFYTLYQRRKLLAGLSENVPTATVRARSWLGPGMLTTSSPVVAICSGDVFTPCPARRPYRLAPGALPPSRMLLGTSDGAPIVTITHPLSDDAIYARIPRTFSYRLALGLASPAGLGYWALATLLSLIALRRAKPTALRDEGTEPSSSTEPADH
jgi:hypothetical protein